MWWVQMLHVNSVSHVISLHVLIWFEVSVPPNQQNVVIHTWVASITRANVLYTQPIIYILYYIYIHTHMWAWVHTHIYIYTHTCVYIYICIHINLYIYTSVIYTYTIHITSMFSCGSLWVLPPETAPVGAWPVQTSVDFFLQNPRWM